MKDIDRDKEVEEMNKAWRTFMKEEVKARAVEIFVVWVIVTAVLFLVFTRIVEGADKIKGDGISTAPYVFTCYPRYTYAPKDDITVKELSDVMGLFLRFKFQSGYVDPTALGKEYAKLKPGVRRHFRETCEP